MLEDLYKLHTTPFSTYQHGPRQYLRTHTFLGESFLAFFDSINALKLKMVVLIEAIGGKGSSSIAIASFFFFFFFRDLKYPFVDHVLYDISETPRCISSIVRCASC